MKKIWMIAACAALLATACSKDEGADFQGQDRQITIDPTILQASESNTRATDLDFEAGDAIGVSIKMSADQKVVAENARFTFNDGLFSSDDNLLWYKDAGLESDMFAYYPYAATVPTEFTIQEDQTGTGYTQSDLMVASKVVKPTLEATNLTFKHQLTKLVVTMDNQCGGKILGVSFKGVKPTGTFDVSSGVAVKSESTPVEVKAHEVVAGTKYAAIVIPQEVQLVLNVKVDFGVNGGGVKTLAQTYKMTDLLNGQYSIGIIVMPDEIKVSISGEIEDWTDNGTLTPEDGSVEENVFEEFEGYFIYHGERYNTKLMKDGRVWMTENLVYLPEGVTPSNDPANNDARVWYPYTSDGTTCTPITDKDAIKKQGYLYRSDLAMNVAEITPENAAKLAGCQGLCPKGWHVPTHKEWVDLIGGSNKDLNTGEIFVNPNAPYYDASIEGAKIDNLDANDFNVTLSGARQRTSLTAKGSYQKNVKDSSFGEAAGELAVTYFWSSSMYQISYNVKGDETSGLKNIQFWSPMTNFAPAYKPFGKLSCLYNNFQNGSPLRCIKNK